MAGQHSGGCCGKKHIEKCGCEIRATEDTMRVFTLWENIHIVLPTPEPADGALVSHRRTVLSPDAEANKVPVGLNLTHDTGLVWPENV